MKTGQTRRVRGVCQAKGKAMGCFGFEREEQGPSKRVEH
jgi:hypothetical protein